MNMKTSGLSALIITAGLSMCFALPLRAAETDSGTADSTAQTDNATEAPDAAVVPKVVKPRAKKPVEAHAVKSGKVASKNPNGRKADDANAAQDDTVPASVRPSIANANARLQAGDGPADNALRTMSTQADNMMRTVKQADPAAAQTDPPAANTEMVAADQVNEVDRSQGDDKTPAPTLSMAVAQAPYGTSNIDSTWSQTSLIGKIFVAFGGLLTVASAARMFMA
jgi:hypothetical protein